MKARLALVLMTPLLAGCLPFAWILPPLKADIGAAARIPLASDSSVSAEGPISLGLQPLGASESLLQRNVDFGAGWNWMMLGKSPHGQGPYAELSWLLPLSTIPGKGVEGGSWRFGLHTRGSYYLTGQGENGFGGALQATFEWVTFDDGPFTGCNDEDNKDYVPTPTPDSPYDHDPFEEEPQGLACAGGAMFGESSIGAYVGTTYAEFADEEFVWVGGGIIFRLPASFGAGFVFAP